MSVKVGALIAEWRAVAFAGGLLFHAFLMRKADFEGYRRQAGRRELPPLLSYSERKSGHSAFHHHHPIAKKNTRCLVAIQQEK